jgi:hypothetical protein
MHGAFLMADKPTEYPDPTFHPISAFGSERWCATTLGKSIDWFRRNRANLEALGFPVEDQLIGLTIRPHRKVCA